MRVHRTLLRTLLCGVVAVAVLAPGGAALADPSVNQVEDQIEKAGGELEDIIEAYNGINENLRATQAAAAALEGKMRPLEEKLNAAYGNVETIAAAAYKGGGGLSSLSAVLNAGSSDAMINQLAALRHISQARQQDVTGYTELKRDLDKEKKRLNDLLAQQTAQHQDLTARRTKIEADLKALQDLRRRLNAAAPRTTPKTGTKPASSGPPPNVHGAAGKAVAFAYAQLGKPYGWGAEGPRAFDCSGLTMKAWQAAGVSLPHNAAQQYSKVRKVSAAARAPGDLVFFRGLGHVGIYIGGDTMIHAPTTGDEVKETLISGRRDLVGYGRPG